LTDRREDPVPGRGREGRARHRHLAQWAADPGAAL